jgi:hypothetical protein
MSPKQTRRSRRGSSSARPHAATHGDRAAFQPHGHTRTDDANAFMPDPEGGPAHIKDDLAESLAEEYLQSATRGSEAADELMDGVVPEEIGGPFVETSAAEEFAHDVDEANPIDAEPEPLPRPVAGLVQVPDIEDDDEEGQG